MEKLLTVEQAADLLAVTPSTVRDWLKRGVLKGVKLRKMWRIRESDLEAFLKEEPKPGVVSGPK